MMASGFRPVGWVAAVAGSAIGCYMLSLNVASERAELLRIEREIIAAKQDIRGLQTELGTRGRMAQLEHWNTEVLALSAPASNQFLDSEMKLARFDQRAPTIEERTQLHMAAAETGQDVMSGVELPVLPAAAETAPVLAAQPLVRRASLDLASMQPVATVKPDAAVKPAPQRVTIDTRAAKSSEAVKPAQLAKAKTDRLQLASLQPAKAVKAMKPATTETASLQLASVQSIRSAKPAKRTTEKRLDDQLVKEINAAARSEAASRGR